MTAFGSQNESPKRTAAVRVDAADLWFDPKLRNSFFMSERLVRAMRTAKVGVDFRLTECRMVEGRV